MESEPEPEPEPEWKKAPEIERLASLIKAFEAVKTFSKDDDAFSSVTIGAYKISDCYDGRYHYRVDYDPLRNGDAAVYFVRYVSVEKDMFIYCKGLEGWTFGKEPIDGGIYRLSTCEFIGGSKSDMMGDIVRLFLSEFKMTKKTKAALLRLIDDIENP